MDSAPISPQQELSYARKVSFINRLIVGLAHPLQRRRVSPDCADCSATTSSPILLDKGDTYIFENDNLIILPLTQSNLRRHHQAMSEETSDGKQYPLTPRKSASDAPSTVDTPSRSSKTSNNGDAGTIMQWHSIYGPEASRTAWEADREFRDTAMTIVRGDRHSAMRPESVKKFQDTRDKLRDRTEATLMERLMPILAKDSRTSMEVHEAVIRDFDADFLDKNLDTEFRRGCVPIPDISTDTLLGSLLAKSPGIKNPKPDIVYGVSLDALSPQQQVTANMLKDSSQLSPGILYPFMIFEWKSAKGLFSEAQDQARRGGAALVNAVARLSSLSGSSNSEQAGRKPDPSTMAFSCVISPNLAHIYVHFRQLCQDGKPERYMAKVSGYQTDENEDVERLRRDIHNILDWGVLTRIKDIKRMFDDIRRKGSLELLLPQSKKRKA